MTLATSPKRGARVAGTAVTTAALVVTHIVRQADRRKCFLCRRRRVLYRVRSSIGYAGSPAESEARCAVCWGIRE